MMFSSKKQYRCACIIASLLVVSSVAFVPPSQYYTTAKQQHWQHQDTLPFPTQVMIEQDLEAPCLTRIIPSVGLIVAGVPNDISHGTQTHLYNAILSVVIPLCFRLSASAGPTLSQAILMGSFGGLAIDNLIVASGKYIGEGSMLRRLTQVRIILHGWTISSLFIPVVETAMRSGMLLAQNGKLAMCAAAFRAIYEMIEWSFLYDINDLAVVDNRHSRKHSSRAMAGTLSYTSGKILKCVMPCVVLQVFTLTVGCLLWARGFTAGPWLTASAALSLVSGSLQRPDIQTYGETAMLSLLLAGVVSAQ